METWSERLHQVVTGTNSRTQSPLWIGAGATVVAAVFALLRFAIATHGHIGAFIILGILHVDPARLPHGVSVHSYAGYDGQFYYRLALNPLDWAHSGFGVRFDSVARIQRIGYPSLVWLFSGGQNSVVPTMLVVVNVLGIGVAAGVSTALAREAGRHPAWGLLMAGYWGFLWTISRDLTEVTAILFTLSGLLAIRKKRNVVAAAVLSVAVLSRETVLVLLFALVAARVLGLVTTGRVGRTQQEPRGPEAAENSRSPWTSRISSHDLTWFVPLVVFAGWQIAGRLQTGRFPVHASGSANAGLPFVGIAKGLAHYVPQLPSYGALLWCGEFVALVVIGGLAGLSLRESSALLHERIAWIGYTILSICLSSGIWGGDVGFRSLDELFVFSCLLLLFSRLRLGLPGMITTCAWLIVAVELVRFI